VVEQQKDNYTKFNVYFQDESRFGLFTRNGKSLTIKGVKPVCPFVQDFKNNYLFGAFSPIDGNHLLLEMPYCDTECFEIFLTELAKQKPEEYKILFFTKQKGCKYLKISPCVFYHRIAQN